ncbi:MAG: YraN family protein [Planctomycetes bacterium]|nr:YraN family protein [Planctomycetota bacterium]
MDDRSDLGRLGEQQAERFLRRLRYRTVARNYRCPLGEIDLIMLDRSTVVFVEVKSRRGTDHADPEDSVTRAKQERLGRCAQYFLRHTHSESRACRFDVVAVTHGADQACRIEHFIDAFVPSH